MRSWLHVETSLPLFTMHKHTAKHRNWEHIRTNNATLFVLQTQRNLPCAVCECVHHSQNLVACLLLNREEDIPMQLQLSVVQ